MESPLRTCAPQFLLQEGQTQTQVGGCHCLVTNHVRGASHLHDWLQVDPWINYNAITQLMKYCVPRAVTLFSSYEDLLNTYKIPVLGQNSLQFRGAHIQNPKLPATNICCLLRKTQRFVFFFIKAIPSPLGQAAPIQLLPAVGPKLSLAWQSLAGLTTL